MDIAQILRSQGFKVTPQRIAIYDALRGHHDHPTAEMLYHTLRPEHPSMSLAVLGATYDTTSLLLDDHDDHAKHHKSQYVVELL